MIIIDKKTDTATGEPMAANYVNLLVENFEHNLLQDYYKKKDYHRFMVSFYWQHFLHMDW